MAYLRLRLFRLAVVPLLAGAIDARAQSTIEITSPSSPMVIAEGDEFFVDVVNDRMDFDKRRDFMWEELFDESTVEANSNVWRGVFNSTGGYVFPLFPGFGDNPDTAGINESALNAGRTGQNFPIDTSKYTLVTYLDRTSVRSNRTLFWSQKVFFPDGTLFATAEDGFYSNTLNNKFPATAPLLGYYDLSSFSGWTSADANGLRIDSSNAGPAGTSVEYSWVRVSDPSSTGVIPVSWDTSNVVPVNGVPPRVSIYVDDDNQGFDGALLASWEQLEGPGVVDGQGKLERPLNSTGSFEIPGSALPPGEYFFYVELWSNQGSDQKLATSGYSAKITISAKPEVAIHAPSMTSGPDYATEVLGNPWDMNSADDIDNLGKPMFQKNFQNESFVDGAFRAQAIIPAGAPPSQIESDVQIWLNVDAANPIDSSKYRYLTYVMEIDETGYGNISDKVGNDGGWVSRVVWWNADIDVDGSVTNDNVIYEGRRGYSVDLAGPGVLEPADEFPAQTGWLASSSWRQLRIDPAEVNDPTFFYLDEVMLTGKPAPTRDQQFTVDFSLTDTDSAQVTTSIYISDDRQGTGSQLVWGPQALAPGAHQITLSTSTWGNTDLYVSVLTDDGANSVRTFAEVPLTFAYADGGSTSPPGIPTLALDEVSPGTASFKVVKASPSDIVSSYEVACTDVSNTVVGTNSESNVVVTGLTDNITYNCAARASNGSGFGAFSSVVVVKSGVDTDGDGVIDPDDAFPDDPTDAIDTDSDGLGDNREGDLGTDPELDDTDGDGFSDGDEVESGTNPLDPDDAPNVGALPLWLLIQAQS
ncbi:MAG: thrombospondin type 3 repeat-containing protein [Pseudomonadota bacterium]